MRLAKKNVFSAVVTVIILALSIVVYRLLPHTKEPFDVLIISCVVVSELLSFINILFYNTVSSKKSLALIAGGYTLTAGYFVLSVVISLLFSIYYRMAAATYLILMAVLTAAFLVAVITTYILGKKVYENSTQAEKSFALFKTLEYKMQVICSNNKYPEYAVTFCKLLGAIKACDQSSYVKTDDKIGGCFDLLNLQLQEAVISKEKVGTLCEEAFSLIRQRGIEVNQLKSGGI